MFTLIKLCATRYLQVLKQRNVRNPKQRALLITFPGSAHSCLQDCTGFIFHMHTTTSFVAVYQDISQDIQQLRARKSFGERLN